MKGEGAMENCAEDAALLPQPSKGSQFSLAGLMLFITWVGMCLGALAAQSGLAIFGAIVVFPSFIRTICLAKSYRAEGNPLNAPELIANFCASMGLMVACGFAALWTTLFMGYGLARLLSLLNLPDLVLILGVPLPFSAYAFFVWLSWSVRLQR